MYRVLVVESHPVLRAMTSQTIQSAEDVQVVGEASTGAEAVELAGKLAPDVVVMDVRRPGLEGIEAIRRIKTELPQTRVVVTSIIDEEDIVLELFEAGAEAYLDKSTSSFGELVQAIHGEAVA